MKIKLLMTGLMAVISASVFAQKGELSNAKSEYDKYETLKGTPLAKASMANAKASIDKAALNEKTATLPLTYALKGAIYSSLAVVDTVATTSVPLFTTAEEALKKAKDADTKGEFKQLISVGTSNLAQYSLNRGVAEYQGGKYDLAYHSFDYYRNIVPEDTTAIFYTGLAALSAKNYAATISNYTKLLTTKYSKNQGIYLDLSSVYMLNKDTANAIKTLSDGVVKYPSSTDLRKREIELSLQNGKEKEVITKIQTALAADPKNKTLYYYAGLTYSQTAEALVKEQSKTKTEVAKNALQTQIKDNYGKAADMYKKALEIDPNYFEANLNLGYVIISPAIYSYNEARKLPANKQKEYEAAIAKAIAQFDLAKPYLVKAVELNPKSIDALTNLRTYYMGKNDQPNAAKIKSQIDALPQQ